MTRSVSFLMVLVVLLGWLNACSGPKVVVEVPDAQTLSPPLSFLAGAAETDITPPPGLPLFGYSQLAEDKAKGYWGRLKSRAIVFEYKKGNEGKRLALVQLEWGAVSRLLYWKVAEKIASLGFKPGDFMMVATHTHAAPGGLFGAKFYNTWGSGGISINPYLGPLVEWLATRVASCIQDACADLKPAAIGATEVFIPDVSRNRSAEAWILNFINPPRSIPYHLVFPCFHVLRVDHLKADGKTVPRAVWVVAPLHGTSVNHKNKYYHGDLFAVATRYLASLVPANKDYGLEKPFVAAMVPGPEGDVSPNYSEQCRNEAVRLGKKIAQDVMPIFNELSNTLSKDVTVKTAYIESVLNGAATREGKLAQRPLVGAPVVGGTEDGRWGCYGHFGAYEGNKRHHPKGDHGVKVPMVADWFQEIAVAKDLPNIATLQLVQLGDVITLAAISGEPTTEVGRLIRMELEQFPAHKNTAVIAVANDYLSYIATKKEYQAQHFEGAFTLFGENEARFLGDQLINMAQRMHAGKDPETPLGKKRVFKPGSKRKVFRYQKEINTKEWEPWPVKDGKNILTIQNERIIKREDLRALDSIYYPVSFYWKGLKPGQMGDSLPTVSVECNGEPLFNKDGVLETDDGLNFIVQRKGCTPVWYATWTPPADLDPNNQYCIIVECPGQKKSLRSDSFVLTKIPPTQ